MTRRPAPLGTRRQAISGVHRRVTGGAVRQFRARTEVSDAFPRWSSRACARVSGVDQGATCGHRMRGRPLVTSEITPVDGPGRLVGHQSAAPARAERGSRRLSSGPSGASVVRPEWEGACACPWASPRAGWGERDDLPAVRPGAAAPALPPVSTHRPNCSPVEPQPLRRVR